MHAFRGRGFKIHYVEQGEGPSVIFAHGAFMDHTIFAAQFEDLPDTHRCIAWDMRGHGQSESPTTPWDVADIAADLIAFIEATNTAPCHLVGHSIGGRAALRVALQREDLVRSLVLVASSAGAATEAGRQRYGQWRTLAGEDQGIRRIAETSAGLFFTDADPDVLAAHRVRVNQLSPASAAATCAALTRATSVEHRLAQLHVPTLVLHADRDQVQPFEAAQRMATAIPGAQFVGVSGGHTPPLEAPDEVNHALTRFFQTIEPS